MKNEKRMWASIINDARFYDGTPQMLTQFTEHFMEYYTIAQKLKQPDVSGNFAHPKKNKRESEVAVLLDFIRWYRVRILVKAINNEAVVKMYLKSKTDR